MKFARLTVDSLIERTEFLHDDSFSGHVVPEVGIEEIRELIYGHYRIIYHLHSKDIFILTVYHSAMQFKRSKLIQRNHGDPSDGDEDLTHWSLPPPLL